MNQIQKGPGATAVGEQTVARVVAEFLRTQDVDRVFGLLGGHIIPIWDVAAQLAIPLVDARDERAAVHMAHAHSELTGELGVALVTAGPGLTNAITAIANAHVSRIPVLIITGCPPRPQIGKGALQELPQIDLVRPITRDAHTLVDADNVIEELEAAVASANGANGDPGPVVIEIPTDVLRETIGARSGNNNRPARAVPTHAKPSDAALQSAVDLVNQAKQPLVITGRGARGASESILGLLEKTGALYLDTQESRGLIPAQHPALVSAVRGAAMRNADLVLLIGRRLDYQLAYGSSAVFEQARFVRIGRFDSEVSDNRRGDIELKGNPAAILEQINSKLNKSIDDNKWAAELRDKNAALSLKLDDRLVNEPSGNDGHMHPYRLLGAVRDALEPTSIVIADGGDILSFARIALPSITYLDPGALGCLGVGVPFAIAASLAYPKRRVIAVIGDGSFGFNAIDIDTAARHRAGAVFVIANNGGWNIERRDQLDRFDGRTNGSLLQYTDYAAVARAFGLHAERIADADELPAALARALDNAPALLDVLVTRDAISPDSQSGLAIVPDLQPLTSWDTAQRSLA